MPPRKSTPGNDNVVFARLNSVLAHAGRRVTVSAGEPWDASDPLVKQYPDVFVPNLPAMRSTVDPRGYRETVERATRAPGERRMTRRAEPEESGEQDAASDDA